MTQLAKDPDNISNTFDRFMSGIGKRGSSFTDLDAITHDGDTDRFLIQEFKGPYEDIPYGQRLTLEALARQPRFTVWFVRLLEDGRLWVGDMRDPKWGFKGRAITSDEYQARVRKWWNEV